MMEEKWIATGCNCSIYLEVSVKQSDGECWTAPSPRKCGLIAGSRLTPFWVQCVHSSWWEISSMGEWLWISWVAPKIPQLYTLWCFYMDCNQAKCVTRSPLMFSKERTHLVEFNNWNAVEKLCEEIFELVLRRQVMCLECGGQQFL